MSLDSGLDLLILLLYANDGTRVRGNTRLMKLLFLVIKEGGFEELEEEFDYKEDEYSPLSSKVYNYTATGKEAELIKVEKQPVQAPIEIADAKEEKRFCKEDQKEMKIYSLTSKGKKIGEALVKRIDRDKWEFIKNIKQKFNKVGLFQILEYVYRKYPEFARKSELERLKPPDVSRDLLELVGTHSPISLKEEKEQIQEYIEKKRGNVKK